MSKSGTPYELFVQNIQQAVIGAEPFAKQKNIKVEHNVHLTDRCGVERQFDLYWEYELGGLIYKHIIECKDYEQNVSIDKVDALIGKMHDLPGIRPIIATRNGYQSGAIAKAIKNNIDILVVRDENIEKDWTDSEGTPLIRTAIFDINCVLPVEIKKFKPIIDREWAIANNIKTFRLEGRSDEIFIDDLKKNEKISIFEYGERIPRNHGNAVIEKTLVEHFEDAYLISKNGSIKISTIEIDYIAPPILTESFTVSPEVRGVIEYLNRQQKSLLLQDGRILKRT